MVFARKRDDHLASTEEFAGQGHLSILNEFTYAPGSFQCSSCAQKDSKRREVVLISVGDWLRASPFRQPNPVRQRSGSVQAITVVACQVGLRFSADREILHRPFESVGPSRFGSTSSSAVQTKTLSPFLGELNDAQV